MLDLGIHALDALCWVLSLEHITAVQYRDDSDIGLDTEAQADLWLGLPEGRGEVACALEVSRVRTLANRIDIVGERASLRVPITSTGEPVLCHRDHAGVVRTFPIPPRSDIQCFAGQLKAFANTVRGFDTAMADGESQARVLHVIGSCYQLRRPLAFPWQVYAPWNPDAKEL